MRRCALSVAVSWCRSRRGNGPWRLSCCTQRAAGLKQCLRLQERLDSPLPALAPDTGLLEAAEGRLRFVVQRVDEYAAGFDLCGHSRATYSIAGQNPRA